MDATSIQDGDHASKWEDDCDERVEAQLREVVASRFNFPPSHIDVEKWDGEWIDFTVWFSFEAAGLAAVRREAERIRDTCGRDVDVFSVVDEANNVVLTEEEL